MQRVLPGRRLHMLEVSFWLNSFPGLLDLLKMARAGLYECTALSNRAVHLLHTFKKDSAASDGSTKIGSADFPGAMMRKLVRYRLWTYRLAVWGLPDIGERKEAA